MTVTPQSDVYLCKTPLENDYKNQLTFANSDAQLNYFNSKIVHNYSDDDYQYIKKDSVINIYDNIDNIIDCNYLFYRNTGFTTKYYFCFITNMEYVNENCTRVYIETDVFQTWMFQIQYKRSFVEREHVNDDTIGLHTVPENVETGEYVENSHYYYNNLDNYKFVVQATEPYDTSSGTRATNFGGIPMAGDAYICSDVNELVNVIQSYASTGKSDAIYNVYICPSMLLTMGSSMHYPGQTTPNSQDFGFSKQTTIDGYTPINKKLLTFPYNYLLVSNNNGSSNILHYERFKRNDCKFIVKGVPTVGASIKCMPYNYDSSDQDAINEEQGIVAGKFPTLNWAVDEYTNWLTQNSVNIGLGIASSGLTIAGGLGMIASGGGSLAGAGSVVSGAMGIANTIGQVYQHSLQPNSARGNVNAGDINVADHKNGFWFYKMSIKSEYAQIIDNYFSMFGYKVNRVKVPNITGRQNWNYVKTINCNFDGDIPQTDLQIIKAMFDNGVTLWHNPNTIFDYSLSNAIV